LSSISRISVYAFDFHDFPSDWNAS